jgi:hypothetical protein
VELHIFRFPGHSFRDTLTTNGPEQRRCLVLRRSLLILGVAALMGAAPHVAPPRSGPQVGDGINGGFRVNPVNGLYGGKSCCPV